MRLAVIIDRIAVSGDRNDYVNGINGNISVSHVEGNCRKVAVCILELIGCKIHHRSAGVRSDRLGSAAEGKVLRHIIQIAVRNRVITVGTVSLAVIIHRKAASRDRNGRVDFIDFDICRAVS